MRSGVITVADVHVDSFESHYTSNSTMKPILAMELTNNEVLKTQLEEIARSIGYKGLTNKSTINFFGKKASRF